MLGVCDQVTAHGQPKFWGARIPLPSNFNCHEWEAIAHSEADRGVIQFLILGFPTGLENPIPTPLSGSPSFSPPGANKKGSVVLSYDFKGVAMDVATAASLWLTCHPPDNVTTTSASPVPLTRPCMHITQQPRGYSTHAGSL